MLADCWQIFFFFFFPNIFKDSAVPERGIIWVFFTQSPSRFKYHPLCPFVHVVYHAHSFCFWYQTLVLSIGKFSLSLTLMKLFFIRVCTFLIIASGFGLLWVDQGQIIKSKRWERRLIWPLGNCMRINSQKCYPESETKTFISWYKKIDKFGNNQAGLFLICWWEFDLTFEAYCSLELPDFLKTYL